MQAGAVRAQLDQYLRDNNVYEQLRSLVSQFGSTASGGRAAGVSAPLVAALVREHGEAFRASLEGSAAAPASAAPPTPGTDAPQGGGGSGSSAGAGAGAGAGVGASGGKPSTAPDVASVVGHPLGVVLGGAASGTDPGATRAAVAGLSSDAAPPTCRQLVLQATGGGAFTTHLASDPPPGAQQYYVLHVTFDNQRFRSTAVAASVEPAFNCSFTLDLVPPDTTGIAPMAALMAWRSPVSLALACVTHYGVKPTDADSTPAGAGGDGGSESRRGTVSVELVSVVDLEWRVVLSRGQHSLTVELPGVGDEAKLGVPIGTLAVSLQLTPPAGAGSRYSQTDIARQVRAENELDADSRRKFFKYAREWWKSYREIHDSFRYRLVKIFAEDECCTHQPVCSFLRPLRAGRMLPSPRHAARFVSLLPYRRVESASTSGDRSDRWHTMSTTLALRYGDDMAHALLLCSLLLGFGLEAYVVCGTRLDAKGLEADHTWVMTRAVVGDEPPSVHFWESLTGQRLAPTATSPSGHRFLRVGCVFSDEAFFANKQPNDLVESCSFVFEDDRCWKAMDQRLVRAVRHSPAVPLTPPTLRADDVAVAIESDLKAYISEYRDAKELSTVFDDQLEYLAGAALAVHEMERITSLHITNPEFQHGLRRMVPPGHTFKGFPIVFNHLSPARIMRSLRGARASRDILDARGDAVKFGLRVAVHAFPEDYCAVWVMLTVVYRPIHT